MVIYKSLVTSFQILRRTYTFAIITMCVLHVLFCSLASSSKPVIYEAISEESNGTQIVEKCQAPGERLARINDSNSLGEVVKVINSQRHWTGLR